MKYWQYICSLILLVFISSSYAESHHPQEFLEQIKGSKNEGEQIFNHFCVNCHALKPLIPIGAPKIGIESDWQKRITQGITVLLKHTDEGFNAMPARGGCFECTNEQLVLAIVYMLPKDTSKDLLNELEVHKKSIK